MQPRLCSSDGIISFVSFSIISTTHPELWTLKSVPLPLLACKISGSPMEVWWCEPRIQYSVYQAQSLLHDPPYFKICFHFRNLDPREQIPRTSTVSLLWSSMILQLRSRCFYEQSLIPGTRACRGY